MGYLDYLPKLFSLTSTRRGKRKVMQTVEVKVKMDCEGCEKKVRNAVSSMRGVKSVEVNRKQSKVTVSGYVKPDKVLKRVRRTGKKAELWPYVPYNLVYYPYAHQAYDRKAPAGYVRNVAHPLPAPNSAVDNLATMFSDDNTTTCSIM
ncbi:heavy metal-associated isoprenylated plant protein 20-like isoform X1 [Rhododendron vialii]|uniref:heavy metal-associated isoprenylated plant protein 20-like isoform X1 n=1 Tax=Rhododendron vialii TaxID=182163 RepID=UPI00265F7FB5|nr:heavy metal-associated isoprenylated plant protein 20-like isoform X1 [Rhododendron vialii]